MKCIVRRFGVFLLAVSLTVLPTGCGEEIEFEQKFDIYNTSALSDIDITEDMEKIPFFAEQLVVGGNENLLAEGVTERLSESSGLFELQSNTIIHAKNIHERLYPASTTKIMTAYVALKYGDLTATTTVSENALELEKGSTLCGVAAGDVISLNELLYGLLMCSGNDAANVIAEMISGNIQDFASLMNQEAKALGASNSHFVNPHGLHDEQHYTTAYDLQLIFREALKDDTFRQIIHTASYTGEWTDSQGEPVKKEWKTSNRYLSGDQEVPEGVNVIGGKTGTTNAARYCLVLYSENADGVPYISVVMKADSRNDLYHLMTELLKKTWN